MGREQRHKATSQRCFTEAMWCQFFLLIGALNLLGKSLLSFSHYLTWKGEGLIHHPWNPYSDILVISTLLCLIWPEGRKGSEQVQLVLNKAWCTDVVPALVAPSHLFLENVGYLMHLQPKFWTFVSIQRKEVKNHLTSLPWIQLKTQKS